MTEYYVIEPCTTANGIEIKLKERKIDIKSAEKALLAMGASVVSGPVVLIASIEGYSVSIYGSGRMMVKTEKKIENRKVEALGKRIIQALEESGAIR